MKPTVTQILRELFPQPLPDEFVLARGTAIHKVMSCMLSHKRFLLGAGAEEIQDYMPSCQAVAKVISRLGKIECDKTLQGAGSGIDYIGHADAVVNAQKGDRVIVEFKTGTPNNIKTTLATLQAAAYMYAAKAHYALIAYIAKNGTYKIVELKGANALRAVGDWMCVLRVYKIRKELGI